MKDQTHENLVGLLQRFMDEPAARTAQEDIQAGERWLGAYPAPAPRRHAIAAVKTQMIFAAQRRHRLVRLAHGSLAAAAAIVILALIGQLGPHRVSQSRSMALIPAALWDSDDITTADVDLAYFSSEVGHLETQMLALETGDEEATDNDTSDEIEMELLAIQAKL